MRRAKTKRGMQNAGGDAKEVENINVNQDFLTLVKTYQNLVFSICLKMTGDYFTSEDLTQETFLSAYLHWKEFDGAQPKAWLCRIASNLCIDWRRQAARRAIPTEPGKLPEEAQPGESEPLSMYLSAEVMEELGRRCRQLKPPYDEVARLHFVEGMKSGEIALRMNRKKKTVDTWIYRARDKLREVYGKEREAGETETNG